MYAADTHRHTSKALPPHSLLSKVIHVPPTASSHIQCCHKVRVFPDLIYCDAKCVDIYIRDDLYQKHLEGTLERAIPCVTYIHGGAWLIGDKKHGIIRDLCASMAMRGVVVTSISYSLTTISNRTLTHAFVGLTAFTAILAQVSTFQQKALLMLGVVIVAALIVSIIIKRPEHTIRHPQNVLDCVHAIHFIRCVIGPLVGGDPEQLFIMGHSAGAHLATLLCMNPEYLKRVNMSPLHIAGCIAIAGVYNERALQCGGIIAQNLLQETFGNDPRCYRQAFPLHHIHPSVCPPMYLLNADVDISLKEHTRALCSRLRTHDIWTRTSMYPHTNHSNIIWYWNTIHSHILDDIMRFIDEILCSRRRRMAEEKGECNGQT